MSAYNPNSWDSLAVNDDNLFALLQKAANPSNLSLDPQKFPAPVTVDTPPASEENSPSPRSPDETESTSNTTKNLRSKDAANADKRKQDDVSDDSDDSDYGQPNQKSQHRSGNNAASGRKSSSNRNSLGANTKKPTVGPARDENRQQKRKEQNRAAQRAFRERKERHVKELEDEVAVLKDEAQVKERENENLRDLLGRLQNENLLLKQSAFTFSFPVGSNDGGSNSNNNTTINATNAATSPTAHRPGASPQQQSSDDSTISETSSSDLATPDFVRSSLFAKPSRSGTGNSFSGSSSSSNGSSPRSIADGSSVVDAAPVRFQSTAQDFGLPSIGNNAFGTPNSMMNHTNNLVDFNSFGNDIFATTNDGGKKNQGGVTTIASNPMFTSYADPMLDPMAWASFGPSDYMAAASPSSGINQAGVGQGQQNDTDNLFSSFNSAGSPGGFSGVTGFNSLEELFASTSGSNQSTTGATPGTASSTGAHSFFDWNPTGGVQNSFDGGVNSFSTNNVMEDPTQLQQQMQAQHSQHTGDSTGCPKTEDDFRRMQQGTVASTFGPPITSSDSHPQQPQLQQLHGPVPAMIQRDTISPPQQQQQRQTMASAATMKAPVPFSALSKEEKEKACAQAKMAALCTDLPKTPKHEGQIEIGRAWEKIRQTDGFKDCDIDGLCKELAAKARCDGSRPVIEESSFNDIVNSLGHVYQH